MVMVVENPHPVTWENVHFLNPHRAISSCEAAYPVQALQTLKPQVLASMTQNIPP